MKRLVVGLLLVFILVGTIACASAEKSDTALGPEPTPSPVPAPAAIIPEGPVPAPEPAPMPPKEGTSTGYDQSWDGERMIVRTGEMVLVVTDVLASIERIIELADNYDGYVVSSNSWREGDRLVGAITIRVDAGSFDDAIRALRGMAVEVDYESTSSKDVTEEYVDLSARLHNLEASEAQLLELMKRAGEVEEILKVQRELSRVTGEIEQTKGRMQYLEQTSSTSLISVQLQQSELGVSFSASSRTVKVGQDIRFNPDIGGGISPFSYEWDFGDGDTSTEVAPTHDYKSDGNYNVTLKVTDDRGQTASKERKNYIDVLPGWSAGKVASGAWNGLVGFGHVLYTIIVWSPVWISIGVILGVIPYFAWWRKRKKKA